MTIIDGDREAITADNQDGMRRRAPSRLARQLLRRGITPPAMKPLALGVPQDALRQATYWMIIMVDHAPMPMEREHQRSAMVKLYDSLLMD